MGLVLTLCLVTLCLVTGASGAHAWCERDCIAVCKVTGTVGQSRSVAACVRESQCSAHAGAQCEGAVAVAARAQALLKGQPHQANANQNRR